VKTVTLIAIQHPVDNDMIQVFSDAYGHRMLWAVIHIDFFSTIEISALLRTGEEVRLTLAPLVEDEEEDAS
jgi:hypothetical protein